MGAENMKSQHPPDGAGHSVPGHENVRLVGSAPSGQLLAVWPMTGVDDCVRVRVGVWEGVIGEGVCEGVIDGVAAVPLTARRCVKAAQLQPPTGVNENSTMAPAGTSASAAVCIHGLAAVQLAAPARPAMKPLKNGPAGASPLVLAAHSVVAGGPPLGE
jgi:hypothetical protein